MLDAEPLPPSKWRERLKKASEWGLLVVLFLTAAAQFSMIFYFYYLAYFAFRE
jgi:hypothetical protein